jgi:hypothetical protein
LLSAGNPAPLPTGTVSTNEPIGGEAMSVRLS